MPLDRAVVDAGAVRFRPMLLTALAVVVGALVVAGLVYVFVRSFTGVLRESALEVARAREESAVGCEGQGAGPAAPRGHRARDSQRIHEVVLFQF